MFTCPHPRHWHRCNHPTACLLWRSAPIQSDLELQGIVYLGSKRSFCTGAHVAQGTVRSSRKSRHAQGKSHAVKAYSSVLGFCKVYIGECQYENASDTLNLELMEAV